MDAGKFVEFEDLCVAATGRRKLWLGQCASPFPELLSILTLTDQKARRCQLAYGVTFCLSELKS